MSNVRTNLCTNPSFEYGTTGWMATGATSLAQSTAQSVSGSHSLKVTWDALDGDFPQIAVSLIDTMTFTASLWVYVPAGQPAVQVHVLTASTAFHGDTSTTEDAWERLSCSFTADGTTATVYVARAGNFPLHAGDICYLDAVLVEQAQAVRSYFDGDTTDASWSGTPGDSTSTLTAPFTIDATADPGNTPPRYGVSVSGSPGVTCAITRTNPDGTIYPIRGAEPAVLVGGEWDGWDYETPFYPPPNIFPSGDLFPDSDLTFPGGQAIIYTATPDDGTTPATVTVPAMGIDGPWLLHPGIPDLSQPIHGLNLADSTTASGAVLHDIAGRKYPAVVSDGTRKAPTWQLSCKTDTRTERVALEALIEDGTPLLLQIVYDFAASTVYQWVAIGNLVQGRRTGRFGDERRLWTADLTVVDRPAGGVQAQRTWADVVAELATWQDVINKYDTWADLIAGTP